jgi:hypothetical protein
MLDNSISSEGAFKKNQKQVQKAKEILRQNYNTLAEERLEINRMIHEYETINAAYDNGTTMVNSSYSNYIVLLFVTILLVFLLIKFSLTGDRQYGGKGGNNFKLEAFFLIGIMIVFLGLSEYSKNYNGYIFVSVILIAYIIAKIKMAQ